MRYPDIMASLVVALLNFGVQAGTPSFTCETDKPALSYAPGEKMTFKISLLENGKSIEGKTLKWTISGDDGNRKKGSEPSSHPLVLSTSIAKPGFVRVKVEVIGENGWPIRNDLGNEICFEGGAGAAVEKLQSYPEPEDFDDFWTKQKSKLASVPLNAHLNEIPSANKQIVVFDVKVDCAGGKPVSGYLCKPKGGAIKSLPAWLYLQHYSVVSQSPALRNNALTFSINGHGIENGKDEAYYKKLQEGELKNYAFDKAENSNPETAYFNGMALRLMRALEFLKSQPEWDGKTLIVSGSSQGGFQALLAAGLDKDVTKCYAYHPWCCDIAGSLQERMKSYFRPEWTEALGYYDPVNHAKRVKCETVINAGLGDYCCPPSGLATLYNNIKTPKRISFDQGMTHSWYDPNTFPHSSRFIIISNFTDDGKWIE